MTTLREALQAEIATAKADLAAKEAKLATFETTFEQVLSHDVDEVKAFFRSVGQHLFPHPVPADASAPAATIKQLAAVAGAMAA